jgi:putative Ca2+/H+ antiporter (TMEM165/GDT1 family)
MIQSLAILFMLIASVSAYMPRHTLSMRLSSNKDDKHKRTTPVVLTKAAKFLMKNALPVAAVATGLLGFQHSASAVSLLESLQAKASSSGFVQAFLLIFVSEIGDKTFFIAGLLAAKYSRFISFVGSMGALAVMTIISTAIGQLFHAVPPGLTKGVPYDDYIAVAAFAYFGAKTLYDAYNLEAGDSSGIEEEKAEAEKSVEELASNKQLVSGATLALLVQTFSLVFAAEIGDRSFLSTIALSAALNPFAVAGGAIAAHASATGVAVAGGALMSKYLSEKTIGYIGGSLFLIFSVTTAFGIF